MQLSHMGSLECLDKETRGTTFDIDVFDGEPIALRDYPVVLNIDRACEPAPR